MNRAERRAKAGNSKRRKREADIDAAMAAGVECHRAGDLAAAERHYRAVLRAGPGHGDATHLLGVLALSDGRPADAVVLIRRALDRKPDFAEAYNNLGMALAETGDADAAEAAYRQSISMRGDFADPHTNLGNHALQAGDSAAAIEHYRHSLSIAPADADTYFNLGNAHMESGAIDGAIDAYGHALDHDPAHGPALRNLAHNLKERAGRAESDDAAATAWRRLQQCAEAALQADARTAEPWFHLASARRELGEASAADALRAYLQRDEADAMGARLALAALGEGELPIRHSPAYIARLYAEKTFLGGAGAERRGYNGHRLILDAVAPILSDGMRVLDAGCGAGRLGLAIRGRVASLDGFDIADRMTDRARKTNAYDHLETADLETFLPRHRDRYDVIILAAVLVHYGDLSGILPLLRQSLRASGSLVFTVFKLAGDGARNFDTTAYNFFAHGAAYLEKTLTDSGFPTCSIQEAIHEYHGDEPRMCYVVTAR